MYQTKNSTQISQRTITRRTFLLGAAALLSPNPAFAAEVLAQPRFGNVPDGFVATTMKVHFLPPTLDAFFMQDIIVVELLDACGDKRFVLVDGGFGPKSDGRDHDGYVSHWTYGFETAKVEATYQHMMNYLYGLGVAPGNVLFYLGTHAHADHMGAAAEIIEAFRPAAVFTPEYDDSYLKPDSTYFTNRDGELVNGSNLYDNQRNFDAALAAAESVGASIVTSIGSWEDARFEACGCAFTLLGWDTDYRSRTGDDRCCDANDFCWGLLIEGCGRKVFLGADINNALGSEARIAEWFRSTYGDACIDLMKLCHHGFYGSNSDNLMSALNPRIAVHTSGQAYFYTTMGFVNAMKRGMRIFSTKDCRVHDMEAIVVTLSESDLSCNLDGSVTGRQEHGYQLLFADGRFVHGAGWYEYAGGRYYCTGLNEYGCSVFSKGFQTIEDALYCFNENGRAITGWWQDPDDDRWYYFESNGAGANRWVYGNGTPFRTENGNVVVGWVPYGGKWYYLHEDYRWARSELLELEGKTYGFDAAGKAIANGWLILNGAYYHFDGSGCLERDTWICYGGCWYYLGSDGRVVTNGEASYEGKRYWMGSNGRVVKQIMQ